jgi:ribosomal protein S18 acetylase RimI-like enzyme
MDDIVIRHADEKDLSSLGRLGALLLRAHFAFDPLRFIAPGTNPEENYAWFLRSQLREQDVVVLVAARGESVLGYVYAGIEPKSWKELRDTAGFIHDVVVDESSRNSGIGQALLEAAIEWLHKRGVPRVVLWTADQNHPAQRLFSRLGFRRTMIEMTREMSSSGGFNQ